MLSDKDKDFFISLNHSSRELLQIMLAVKSKLENLGLYDDELKLSISLDYTFETIRRQIEDVDQYLKNDTAIKPLAGGV